MMEEHEIIEWVRELYTNDRKKLIEKLRRFDWENSVMCKLHDAITAEIARPTLVFAGIVEKHWLNNFKNHLGETATGDTSDYYLIVMNENIHEVSDWDFTTYLKNNQEVRTIKLWINWLAPLYYLETSFDHGIPNQDKYKIGLIKDFTSYETRLIQQVEQLLASFNYKKCELNFLKQNIEGASTDVFDTQATLFECLFSDWRYYREEDRIISM